MKRTKRPSARRVRQRTAEIRNAIAAMDYACSGTLHSRTKVCGRSTCKCASNDDARHGPYHEWTRRKDGRLVNSVLAPDQAAFIQRAIKNRREIDRLLALSEDETAAELLGSGDASA